MKRLIALFITAITLNAAAQEATYKEQYRPQFHFSPAVNWTNDPNGLVYFNGNYHIFYQHNPFGIQWGHMSWGHAISKDLIHWQNLPVAIPEENGVMIFSGTCVADEKNTSGFGKNGIVPLVAVYTGHTATNQSQYVAYSLDEGKTFTKYANNPVLDLHKKDFRDPKIFWYEPKQYWVMVVVLPDEHKAQFYQSKNLLNWTWMSDFGPAGDINGVWECPDLFEAPIDNEHNKKKWVLTISANPPSRMQYFVGEFDGTSFHNENNEAQILRPDYGTDYYAGISYNHLNNTQAPVMIGWANNWAYANDIPTSPWRSAMSLPRNIAVHKNGKQWTLLCKPINALQTLRDDVYEIKKAVVTDKQELDVLSQQFEMSCTLDVKNIKQAGVRIALGDEHYTEIGYDASTSSLYIDRSKSGNTTFNKAFEQTTYCSNNLKPDDGKIQLHIFFDNSIIEVFANDGELVMTSQIFPGKEDDQVTLFSKGGTAVFSDIKLWEMKSAWSKEDD
jgi:fructan beta-fructosidase